MEAIRALKKATTFEIQKITKRLKKSREEKEETSSISRLEDELESVKCLETDELARYYLQHNIFRSHKQLAVILDIEDGGEAPHRTLSDSAKNVVGRLFGSKTFRTVIEHSIESLEIVAGIKRKDNVKKKKVVNAVARISETDTLTGNKEQSEHMEVSSTEEDTDLDAAERTSPLKPNPSSTSSTFLPSLQSGYIPAIDGSDDEGELKGLFPAQKKERKNRRGQRARRKILEAKHGNKANHIIKEREQAQIDYEERVARRAAKEAEKTGANAIAIEEAEKNRKERREALLRPIHTSWALAKAQKERLKQAKPEGNKITFD